MIDASLLAKFKRRAPHFESQEHLDKAMFLFPTEHHEEIAAEIQPLLTTDIIARKVNALPELKIKDPENPTLHESTVLRLNTMAARIAAMETEIALLTVDRNQWRTLAEERDAAIAKLMLANVTLENAVSLLKEKTQ